VKSQKLCITRDVGINTVICSSSKAAAAKQQHHTRRIHVTSLHCGGHLLVTVCAYSKTGSSAAGTHNAPQQA
jgi:hypothetical protein